MNNNTAGLNVNINLLRIYSNINMNGSNDLFIDYPINSKTFHIRTAAYVLILSMLLLRDLRYHSKKNRERTIDRPKCTNTRVVQIREPPGRVELLRSSSNLKYSLVTGVSTRRGLRIRTTLTHTRCLRWCFTQVMVWSKIRKLSLLLLGEVLKLWEITLSFSGSTFIDWRGEGIDGHRLAACVRSWFILPDYNRKAIVPRRTPVNKEPSPSIIKQKKGGKPDVRSMDVIILKSCQQQRFIYKTIKIKSSFTIWANKYDSYPRGGDPFNRRNSDVS